LFIRINYAIFTSFVYAQVEEVDGDDVEEKQSEATALNAMQY
jgi:hypothetical protein